MNRTSISVGGLVIGLVLATVTALPASARPRTGTSVSVSAPAVSRIGTALKLTGQVLPRGRRTVMLLELRGTRWTGVRRAVTTRRGKYALQVHTSRPGRVVYRVHVLPSKRRRAAVSRLVAVTVTAPATTPAPVSIAGGGAASFTYLMGEKYRWNPCEPIGYRVNPSNAPEGWQADLTGTMQRVQARSGLRLTYLGTTSVQPRSSSYPSDTRFIVGYGRHASGEFPDPGVAGIGGAFGTTVQTARGYVRTLTQGFVLINSDGNDNLAGGFGSGNPYGYQGTRGQLLMHEVAHAIGLGHAESDRAQIMYPQMQARVAEWGRGDTAGLASVGASGGCIVPLSARDARQAPAPVVVVAMP